MDYMYDVHTPVETDARSDNVNYQNASDWDTYRYKVDEMQQEHII